LLYALIDLRDERGARDAEYYYGAVAPSESLEQHCESGCTVGVGLVPLQPGGLFGVSVAAGLGYAGEDAAETMIHEIGHSHGRLHAPCGADDPDPEYPYPDGSIGVWGYDLFEDVLLSPTGAFDFMGYCLPYWVSDYTYAGLFDWIEESNQLRLARGPSRTWRSLLIGARGQVRLGRSHELVLPPSGEEREIELLDSELSVLGLSTGYLTPFDHLPGGLLLFQEPPAEVAFVRIDALPPVAI
jgi:hypothetical protein